MARVFTYGTLVYPEIWSAVTGTGFQAVPAWLHGFRRRALRGREYPGLLAGGAGDGPVPGLLHLEVSGATLAVLDRFEGSEYAREIVEAEVGDAVRLASWVYVLAPAHRGRATSEPWDPIAFRGRPDFEVFRRRAEAFARGEVRSAGG